MYNILIYQSITTGNNLGDIGMIEGVVRRLLYTTSEAHLCVHYIPWLPEEIWELKNVSPVSMGWFSESTPSLSCIKKIPYLRRYEQQFKYMMLGRGIDVSDIRVGNSPDNPTLESWCRQYDAMHVVGMGGLTEYFPDDVWHFCCLTHAFTSQGKPVILTGQQLGPFSSQSTIHLMQKALRKAKFVGLREPTDSLVFCKDADLEPKNFAVMGDDSFGLSPASSEKAEAFLSHFNLISGNFIAINLRVGYYVESNAEYAQQFIDLISNLLKRYDMPFVVVPIDITLGDDSDIVSGYRLVETIGGDRIIVLDKSEELNSSLVKSIIGKAYAGVGVSYHFCTFALSQGVPAVCVFDGAYYSQKARGIASFWGDSRLALPLNKLHVEEATKQVTELIEDQQFRDALHTRAEIATKEWETIFDGAVEKMLAHYQTG